MRKVLLLAAAAVLLAAPALAESVQTFVGNTIGGPTFNRPELGDPPASLSGVHPHYSVQSFKLLRDARCYVVSAQTYDGFIHLYRGSFNPGSPLTHIVSSDDDGILGTGSSYMPSAGTPGANRLSLPQDTYVLVTSAYAETGAGQFQNAIHCEPTSGSAADPILVQGSCGAYAGFPEENGICLSERFLVAIHHVTNGPTERGTPVRIGSNDTGLFWFYNDTNWEVMLKTLDGCGINGHWWVFGGALTNQGYEIVVTDTHAAGDPQKRYANSLGTRAAAIADTTAFSHCP